MKIYLMYCNVFYLFLFFNSIGFINNMLIKQSEDWNLTVYKDKNYTNMLMRKHTNVLYVFCCFYDVLFFRIDFLQISKYKTACNQPEVLKTKWSVFLLHLWKLGVYRAFYTQTYEECQFWLILGPLYDN